MIYGSKILLPTIVGISVYILITKFFPEEVQVFEKDTQKGIRIRGGSRFEVCKEIAKKLLKDKALKIAIISIFTTSGIQHFQSEIEALLVDDVFRHICAENVNGKLKVVCDIVKEHDLTLHTKSMKTLIVSNNLGHEEKISLLKIKFDFIINGECSGKKRFLIMAILSAVIGVTLSGVGGLALILEALYRLFQEGKISRALYTQLVKAVAKQWGGNVPVEHFLD